MNLTEQQSDALSKISNWYEGQQHGPAEPFRLFGYAGTGKTTLAKEIGPALGVRPVFGAYTGKAAQVLRSKGADATTIHSALYRPVGNAETERRLREARQELENLLGQQDDPPAYDWDNSLDLSCAIGEQRELINGLAREAKTIGFELNEQSPWAEADLIILDEVSMVNAKIGQDIEGLRVPILVLGDPAQLPPIEGGGYYTTGVPDAMLTEIMRTAEDSPIDHLAMRIRTGRTNYGLTPDDYVSTDIEAAMAADQVLVWRNTTRWNLTLAIRKRLGRPDGRVVPGDRVMCLTNNKDLGVLNGQQFDVMEVEQGQMGPRMLLAEIGSDRAPRWIKAYADGFMDMKSEQNMKRSFGTHRGDRGAFTFANVITVHKAQGSQWNDVYVVDQSSGVVAMATREMTPAMAVEMGRKWLYTAVTRAADHVTLARR